MQMRLSRCRIKTILLDAVFAGVLFTLASAAYAESQWESKYWLNAGVRFHYVEMGRGVPVILIHQEGGNAADWFLNGIGPSLARTNRVIALDMRNHGLTTPNPAPVADMARDVLDFMNAHAIEKAHIGGYSMGAFVTLQLMALAPGRFLTAHLGGAGPAETSEWIDKIPPDRSGTPDIEAQAIVRSSAATVSAQLARGREQSEAADANLDLNRIQFPVLSVVGEFAQPKAAMHRLWRELNDYRVVILPGRGHFSSIAADFIHPRYIEVLTEFISANNPRGCCSK